MDALGHEAAPEDDVEPDETRDQQAPDEPDPPADAPGLPTEEADLRAEEPDLRRRDSKEAASEDADAVGAQPALLRLHAALKDLDHALFEARRALDVALDRAPDSEPPPDLPYKELRRLAEHLKDTGRRAEAPSRARISELLEAQGGRDEADDEPRRTIVGVAPSGKLESD